MEFFNDNYEQLMKDPSKLQMADSYIHYEFFTSKYGWFTKCAICGPERNYCYQCSCVSSRYSKDKKPTFDDKIEACDYAPWFPKPDLKCRECTHDYKNHYSTHQYRTEERRERLVPAVDVIKRYTSKGGELDSIFENAAKKLNEIAEDIN